MNSKKKVYVALGGNVGDPLACLKMALEELKQTSGISDLKVSKFYKTTPVSDLPQEQYVNAVCSFDTTYSVYELLEVLQSIEKRFGKNPKPKNYPRTVDLDILFYSNECIKNQDLEIPHPRFQERLFVLVPLSDLIDEICVGQENKMLKFTISSLLKEFSNINNETVLLIDS